MQKCKDSVPYYGKNQLPSNYVPNKLILANLCLLDVPPSGQWCVTCDNSLLHRYYPWTQWVKRWSNLDCIPLPATSTFHAVRSYLFTYMLCRLFFLWSPCLFQVAGYVERLWRLQSGVIGVFHCRSSSQSHSASRFDPYCPAKLHEKPPHPILIWSKWVLRKVRLGFGLYSEWKTDYLRLKRRIKMGQL